MVHTSKLCSNTFTAVTECNTYKVHNYGIDTSQFIIKNFNMTLLSTTHVAADDSTAMTHAS